MVSSVDGLAGAAAVNSSGAASVAKLLDFTPDEQASQPPDIALA
jgi:hypothetical protein